MTAAASPLLEHAAAEAASRDAFRAFGAETRVLEELLAYSRSHFAAIPAALAGPLPLPDEPFVAAWERYLHEADSVGAWPCLRDRLVQLRFPVVAGMSRHPEYQAATRWGASPPSAAAPDLPAPGTLRVWLHPTPAGRIPVLLAANRADFVFLVRALTRRNEPDPVPDSMGACIVAGYNNWDRVRELRRRWEAEHPHATDAEWRSHFRTLLPRKELYQDRFILLSSGWYSATPPAALGLDPARWDRISVTIRLEHECAHYFTRRFLGSMRNSLHDELIADYAGISAALGHFRADWFFRFLGLADHPRFTPGGRIENYRGTPPLSDPALRVLSDVVVHAARELERFDRASPPALRTAAGRPRVLAALTQLSLPELALPGAALRVLQHFWP